MNAHNEKSIRWEAQKIANYVHRAMQGHSLPACIIAINEIGKYLDGRWKDAVEIENKKREEENNYQPTEQSK